MSEPGTQFDQSATPPAEAVQKEQKNETLADRYIARYFHPHPELPERIPDQFRDMVLSVTPENMRVVMSADMDEIWGVLRSGIGGLCAISVGWENAAKYLASLSQGDQDAVMSGGPGTSTTANVVHIFRNLRGVWSLAQRLQKVVPNESSEEVVTRIRELIDGSAAALEECTVIENHLCSWLAENQELLEDKEDAAHEIQRAIKKVVSKIDKDVEVSQDSIDQIFSLAQQWSSNTGLPWFLGLIPIENILEQDRFSSLSTTLTSADRVIYRKLYWTMMSGNPWSVITESIIASITRSVKGDIDQFTDDVETKIPGL